MSEGIEVQLACEAEGLPSEADFIAWARAALGGRGPPCALTLRLVDEGEGAHLNETYRRGRGATNVLAFAFEPPPGAQADILGDVAICAPVVAREAREQRKALDAHYAHMVVHGTLHLLGYEHENEQDASRMEAEEVAILARLGYANPYDAFDRHER